MVDTIDISNLASAIRGDILQPETPGYDDARSIWNTMIDRRPSLIVRCFGVADVAASVNFAREQHLPLSI